MKICNKCHQTGEFRADPRNKDGLQGICRRCQRAYQTEFNKEWNSLKHVRDYKRDRELTRFWPGISANDARANYNELFTAQDGSCAICFTHQNELKMALAVDHDHTTGQVRGLLCGPCNRMLGMAKDSVRILENAKAYLGATVLKAVANEG